MTKSTVVEWTSLCLVVVAPIWQLQVHLAILYCVLQVEPNSMSVGTALPITRERQSCCWYRRRLAFVAPVANVVFFGFLRLMTLHISCAIHDSSFCHHRWYVPIHVHTNHCYSWFLHWLINAKRISILFWRQRIGASGTMHHWSPPSTSRLDGWYRELLEHAVEPNGRVSFAPRHCWCRSPLSSLCYYFDCNTFAFPLFLVYWLLLRRFSMRRFCHPGAFRTKLKGRFHRKNKAQENFSLSFCQPRIQVWPKEEIINTFHYVQINVINKWLRSSWLRINTFRSKSPDNKPHWKVHSAVIAPLKGLGCNILALGYWHILVRSLPFAQGFDNDSPRSLFTSMSCDSRASRPKCLCVFDLLAGIRASVIKAAFSGCLQNLNYWCWSPPWTHHVYLLHRQNGVLAEQHQRKEARPQLVTRAWVN